MTTPGGPIDIQLNLDSSGFTQGAQQAVAATGQLDTAVGGVIKQQTMLHRVLGVVTPFRTAAAAMTGGVAAAAAQESRLADLAAAQAVTGQSARRLTSEMNSLARTFPLGQRGAEALVGSITRAGVTAKGTEGQVGSLAKQFAQLGAATGESADQLATGMIKFQRSFGNMRLDNHQIEATNDSLTKLTRTTGASASSILSFAGTITPLTRQAGIGQKATLGIAAAFSKMGEDGFAGVNAISKVMTDLNLAARDGGEQMNTYASIVGKTRKEFEELYKADPAKALGEVTKALASPGAAGQRNLERIGLDGVRTQRILTGLSQQGGLDSTIRTAMEAEKGTTENAAEASEKTLHASAERAAAAAEQLSIALGKPLIPLAKFTTGLGGAIASGATKALGFSTGIPGIDTGIGGLGIGGIAAAGAGLYGATKIGSALGVARTMSTSQIARSAFAGFAKGRKAKTGFAAEFGAPILNAMEGDYLGYQVRDAKDDETPDFTTTSRNWRGKERERKGMYMLDDDGERKKNTAGRAANRIAGLFEGIGEAVGPKDETKPKVGMGERFGSIWKGGAFYGSNMIQAAGHIQAGTTRIGREKDPMFRDNMVSAEDGGLNQGMFRGVRAAFKDAYKRPTDEEGEAQGSKLGAAMKGLDPDKLKEAFKGAGGAVRNWRMDVEATQRPMGNMRRSVMGLSNTFRQAMASGAGLARTFTVMGAKMMASPTAAMAKGMVGMVANPYTLALAAGTMGYERFKGVGAANKAEGTRLDNMGISQNLDDYRESLGRASESTHTLGDNMQAAARMVSTSAKSFSEALSIRPEDRTAAENTKDKVVHEYGASARSTAAVINASAPNGMAPDELNAIKIDLLRQGKSDAYVRETLKGVQYDPSRSERQQALEQTIAPKTAAELAEAIAPNAGTGGRGITKSEEAEWEKKSAWGRAKAIPGMTATLAVRNFTQGASRPGGRFNTAEVSKAQQTAIDAAAQGLAQSQDGRTNLFGGRFAQQQTYLDANQIASSVASRGDKNAMAKTAQALAKSIGATGKVDITAQDIEKYGGFTQAVAAENKDFGEVYKQQTTDKDATQRINLAAGKGLTGTEQLGIVGQTAQRYGGSLAGAFDNRLGAAGTQGNSEVAASVSAQQDAAKFREAVNAMVDGAVKGGASLGEVATSAYKLSGQLDSTTQEYALVRAAREEAQFRQDAQQPFQSVGQNLEQRMRRNQGVMSSEGPNKATDEEKEAARRDQAAAVSEYAGMLKQKLIATRDYNISKQRGDEDFYLAQRQQAADYRQSVERSDEDFYLGRTRSLKAFGLQMARSTADYLKGVLRSQQDYRQQLKRAGEDSAKALIDPFTRLQTQPVWDTNSLLANMKEQLQAVNDQMENLRIVRKRGLSQAVIDMLGLSDPGKAQQLARIVADTTGDATQITDLNKSGGDRTKATTALASDTVDVRRQNEDFRRGQKRGAEDFRQSMDRSRADFNLSLTQQLSDYNKQMARGAADQKKMLDRSNTAYALSLVRMGNDFARSQQEFSASFETLQKATTDQMHGKAVKWGDLMVNNMGDTTKRMVGVINDFRSQFGDLYGDLSLIPETPKAAKPKKPAGMSEANWRLMQAEGGPGDDGGKSWAAPVVGGRPSSGFGPRKSPGGIGSTNHAGQDWAVPVGTAVKAFMEGVVQSAGPAGGYGNMVELAHGNGRTTRYGHLSRVEVAPGDRVKTGEEIAKSGNTGNSTGPHLHFETRQGGIASNPLTTMSKWAGSPVSLAGGSSAAGLTAADLPDDVMNAIKLMGITPEQFLEHLRGAGTKPAASAPANVKGNVALGKQMAEAFRGWGHGGQWDALYQLWQHESGWNNTADNPSSTAFGIPQFLDSTWRGYGVAKTSDPGRQIQAGLKYIAGRYGDPSDAWSTWQSRTPHWYGNGAIFTGAKDLKDGRGVGERGPEAIIPLNTQGVNYLAQAMSKFISRSDAQQMSTNQARTHITYHSETHEYDQRVVVEHATVVSEDPDAMARKLESKVRQGNLVGGPRRR